MTTASKTALIAGASGLVGNFCLELLLQSKRYAKVISIGRRQLAIQHPKLQQLIVDFDKLENYKQSLIADDIYCCLGTTIKEAGSQDNFYKVDFTYAVKLASLTALNSGSQFLVVSALGADAQATIFYSRVKGQMEQAIQALPFKGIHIFQPSLLLGNRQKKRLGERIAQIIMPKLNFLLLGPLRRYRPVPAKSVAQAMLYTARQDGAGVQVHDPEKILIEAKALVM